MSKYFISVPVDYVIGHLRYGHFEGVVELKDDEINNKEKLKKLIRENCELWIDDWEIDSYGPLDMNELELRRVENDEWFNSRIRN